MRTPDFLIRTGLIVLSGVLFLFALIMNGVANNANNKLYDFKHKCLKFGLAYKKEDIEGVERIHLRDLNKSSSENVRITTNGFVEYKHTDYTWMRNKHPAIEYDEEIPFTYSANSDIVRLKIAARKVDETFEQVIKRINDLEKVKIKQAPKKDDK